ncbi:MAG: glutamate--tRNA ligase [Betaproteobacteria bacterium]|nr:MAG: glutamate--tRNA ligase [Betaproteobacteria bacterium]
MIRTRFAPSPTGYLHIGGARTALFSWAYARHHGGLFVLRIEDTDQERSTLESERAILEGMSWLGLDWDEGPFYQMKRLDRYKAVADQLLADGNAYWCYASKEEIDLLREQQRARNEKPRYDGRWRPETGKTLPTPPAGVTPVLRFKTPSEGAVTFNDLVKGPITVANSELDDLVLVRGDGIPTYNFGVVIDDWDMGITHVIRGDDHVNNTPRQIHLYQALGAPLPVFAHVPMILGHDGERLSKRHGAVSVMQYLEDGYLPEALLNYLARLGWGHGDDEKFSMAQFIAWFDTAHISHAPSRFNQEKLTWLNQHYLKEADNDRLAGLVRPRLTALGVPCDHGPDLSALMGLLKGRVSTINELADAAHIFFVQIEPAAAELQAKLDATGLAAIKSLGDDLATCAWTAEAINDTLKACAKTHGIKLGAIGVPLRLMLFGTAQTPSLDATLLLLGRDETLRRLAALPHATAILNA